MASTKSENDESTAREDEERADEDESTASTEAEQGADDDQESDEDAGSDDEDAGSDDEDSDDEGSDDEGSDDEGSDDEDSDDEGSDDEDSDDESSDDESSDDESSDEEGSDDESSDEEDGSDEDSDDADESATRASTGGAADQAQPSTKKAKSGKGAPRRSKKDGLTAGARLAAAKAAKAARKAAKLGKEKKDQDPLTQVRESQLAQKAERAGSWAKENRTMVWAVVAALVLGLGGWIGYRYYDDQQTQAAGSLLEDALEIADAEIVSEEADAPERDADDPPTFPSEQARAEASLDAFRQVIAQYPSSSAAPWARLGEARALFDLGRHGDARASYQRAVDEGGSDPAVVWRALEGKGFTLEADEQWADALEVYQELASIDSGRFEPVAKYHMARMYLAQGERERATDTLRGLVESLRGAADDEETQDFEYVLAQAQVRLRELDPSAAPAPPSPSLESPFGGAGGGPGGSEMSPEQWQELIRRIQQQQQQGGGGLPGGPPGGGPPGGGAE